MGAGHTLGFDVGSKRIGVAIGHALTGSAGELGLIEVRDGVPVAVSLAAARFVRE